ncbi:two component transcriptional regulator, LuxR family [Mesorhizobium albiziae]|uniref:Two component transcriptional regulator, LuxR family n=1 Tax=Neomesorhizobium albiziae TaxID=335020 RepID=A0A1I4E6F8_9HYPH|nr:response regulator transcription factor [Mesorhizobium albiziae]GLS32528.1 DNA-binding response regulator [Mesorhizobium albiziae]SFK99936.1 two component transcriptional regulator, LuxR family [Mesorhizobium albiziae]
MVPVSPIVHIVDDDKSFRTATARLVEASGFRSICYESGDDFLARLPVHEPGCVLLDLQMPGLSGLELQDRLAEAAPQLPIVFLTGHGDIEITVRAMKAGAEDFLEKTASREALLGAIERAMLRYRARLSDHDRTAALHSRVASLTPRELDVFGLIVRGRRNKEVAYALGTSERTVKAHRRSIMEKLGVNSLAEVVSIAERTHLLDGANPTLK